MKKSLALILGLCIFLSAYTAGDQTEIIGDPTTTPPTSSQPTATTAPAETGGPDETVGPSVPNSTQPSDSSNSTENKEAPSETDPTEGTKPIVTEPSHEDDTPKQTEPKETEPPVTTPPATSPPETKPAESVPPETQPEETVPTETAPPETEPISTSPTEEFKQQVAYYAAFYINQYRTSSGVPACTILPGMTNVAEYRADQLTYNYSHSTADKREAHAYYEYGRWIDATIVGLDPSESYYEADTTEAICAGFEGKTAEEMGKYIADLCRNSSNHWSYIGSAKNLYIGIGVEYRAGSAYGWYGCVMVGKTNYG